MSSDIAYTRTKRSNVLTFNSGDVDDYNSSDGEIFKAGDIVELLPAHGIIKKPYASQISGEDVVTIMMAMRNCLKTIPTVTVA